MAEQTSVHAMSDPGLEFSKVVSELTPSITVARIAEPDLTFTRFNENIHTLEISVGIFVGRILSLFNKTLEI